jgi:hypothetical protein
MRQTDKLFSGKEYYHSQEISQIVYTFHLIVIIYI